MNATADPAGEWLQTRLGQLMLAEESRMAAAALDTVFGEQLVQIGCWGERDLFLRHARTQRRALVCERPGAGVDLVCATGRLAIASDSVDAVILPHTLEFAASPHALLRETSRILRADGHLIVMSFARASLWGLRFALSRRGFPAGQQRMISDGRLRDWLELLSFAVGPAERYCHAWPIERPREGQPLGEHFVSRRLPFLAGGTFLTAQKRVHPLTPVRPLWRRKRLRVVGGLVEPTTRGTQSRESSR